MIELVVFKLCEYYYMSRLSPFWTKLSVDQLCMSCVCQDCPLFDHRRAVGFERVYGPPPKIRVARWNACLPENRMLSSLDCWVLLAAKRRAEVRELWVDRVF
jgi:hypothetical protein